MLTNPLRKNKINLADYNYSKDIECRKLMVDLSVFEVDILTEVIQGSLKSSIQQLAEHVDANEEKLLPSLEKLQKFKLFKLEGTQIHVDKEMRKYYESQIPKFDDEFRADIEFIKGFLSKVPIHVLPTWYSIPRTSDDIFGSILEKYLSTPKIYQRYLDEITFDEPVLNQMMNDVYNQFDYKIRAHDVIEKYQLSREQFEEYMLLLEFNLACCLSYNQSNDHWEEVITPFYEWREFLRLQRNAKPKQIESEFDIVRKHPHDFGFVMDMSAILKEAQNTPITVKKNDEAHSIEASAAQKILSHKADDPYLQLLIETLIKLKLVKILDQRIVPQNIADTWFNKQLQEQAITIYRYGTHERSAAQGSYIDRDLREIEYCLKRFINNKGWIYFSDFIKGCCAPIGENTPVALVKKGRRWSYQMPSYSEKDITTIHRYIFETLFSSGLVATGDHKGKECFRITPFGRMTMD